MSIRNSIFSGTFWTFTDTFFLKGLSFLTTIFLARILGPEEFGVIGVIGVFIAIGAVLVDSGMSASIVRSKNIDKQDFSTILFLNLFFGGVAYLIIYGSSTYIADFFNQPAIAGLLKIYCLSFFITGFSSVQQAILIKNMQFKKLMILNIPGTIVGICTGVVLALHEFGVLSIIYMYLITQIILSILLWIFSDWRPQLQFSITKMSTHLNFGYKLMLSSLLDTIFQYIYNIVIGKYFSLKNLGYYERAHTFNQYPVTNITNIISRVTYPLLANMQDDNERVTEVYKNLLQFSFFIIAPIMLGAAAVATPVFLLILGKEWLPAVPYFQILCLASMLYPLHAFNVNVLKVYGRSDLFLKSELIKKVIIVLSVIVFFKFGIYGLLWSNVFTSVIALILNTYFSSLLINYPSNKQISDLFPSLVLALTTGLVMLFIVKILSNYSLSIQIIIPLIIGSSVYLSANYFLKTRPSIYLMNLIKK
jgi:O-antigen/teichoic acid export membrane protein